MAHDASSHLSADQKMREWIRLASKTMKKDDEDFKYGAMEELVKGIEKMYGKPLDFSFLETAKDDPALQAEITRQQKVILSAVAQGKSVESVELDMSKEISRKAGRILKEYMGYNPTFRCSCCAKKGAIKVCVRCRDVLYCDTECQRAHWVLHKLVCKQR
jgi:hypothetical protein